MDAWSPALRFAFALQQLAVAALRAVAAVALYHGSMVVGSYGCNQ
jgi:hypothetical protein